MGCGKSFLSKKLSKVLTIDYFDLDNLVELKEKQTIIEIFNLFLTLFISVLLINKYK